MSGKGAKEVSMVETRDIAPSHLLFKVEPLSLFLNGTSHKLESVEFAAGNYTWRMIIYTNDKSESEGDFLTVNLALENKNCEVNAILNIFLYNQILDNYLCVTGIMRHFHALKPEWGISKFVSRNALNEPSNGYVVNDSCIFGAEVYIIHTKPSFQHLTIQNDTKPYQRLFQNLKFSKIESMWSSKKFTYANQTREVTLYPKGDGKYKGRNPTFNLPRTQNLNKITSPGATMATSAPVKDDEVSMVETRGVAPSHFLFKVEPLSLFLNGTGDKLESVKFTAGNYRWRMIIYLNDKSESDGDFLTVNLALASKNCEVNAIVNIFLYNQILDNYLCVTGRMRRFHALKPEWGISKFVSKKALNEPSNGYVVNDSCIFGAEVYVIHTKRSFQHLTIPNDSKAYQRQFKISNVSKIESVWSSEKFTYANQTWRINVYLKGDGEYKGRSPTFYLHRLTDPSQEVRTDYRACFKSQVDNIEDNRIDTALPWFTFSSNWDSLYMSDDDLDMNGQLPEKYVVNDCCILEIEILVKNIASYVS